MFKTLQNAWKIPELRKKLTVQASAFSASAKEKIEAAGGKVEVV